jgi:hypothetical protein
VPTHVFRPGGRGTTHCAYDRADEIDSMAQGSRAIRLAWLEVDSFTGRIRLSWQAQQEDGSWKSEAATLQPGETHPLLDQCRDASADFARRERGPATDS